METTYAISGKSVEDPAAKQAAESAVDAEDEEVVQGMTSTETMEYLRTYKELPPYEVECVMRCPVVRTPFTDTNKDKALSADPDATQDDLDRALEEHEENLDRRTRFHDWVRAKYDAKGYVRVSDEYIARRAVTEDYCRKLFEELYDSDYLEEDLEEEQEEEVAH